MGDRPASGESRETEIEVTPEMIEAGCEARTVIGDAEPDDVVWAIYEAMERVRAAKQRAPHR